ncbi:MAG: hypothetical protein ACTHO8_06050 [Solirubrobacterales bacterium]
MSIAITGRQRELFYGIVLSRLTAIDGVWRAVEDHEWEDAQRLGREFSDLLRLVVDDLGWGEGREEAIRFTTPPDVLQRAIQILRREALVEDDEQREKRLEVAETQIERADAVEACDEILAQLAGESVSG